VLKTNLAAGEVGRGGNEDTPNKSLDVRAKQRLCLLACPLNSELCGGGFAPRHLNRSAFLYELSTISS